MSTAGADGQLDHMVLTYLQERGFTESAAKLRDEAQVPTLPEMTESLRRSVRSVVGSGLLFHSPDAVCSFDRCFRKLREWVEGSLEQYRRELGGVLYPIFVRSYLELVHRGLPDEASDLMAAHRAGFGESATELTALAALRTPEQVADSEVAREYWAGTFELQMSAYSFELLVAFVQAEQLLPFLQMLNGKHLMVLIARRAPPLDWAAAAAAQGSGGLQTAAEIFGQVDAVNAREASLAPLEEMRAEHEAVRAELEQQQGGAAGAASAAAGEPATAATGARAGRRGAEGGEKRAAGPAAAASRIPLPAWSRGVEEAVVLDALHRAPVGPSELPSCCMATLLNASDAVNCAAFSHDAATLASGHSDSTILLSSLRRLREQQQRAAAGGALPAGEPAAVRTLVGHSGPVYALSFSRDDRFLLSASQDGSARLWATSDSAKLAGGSCLVCYRGHGFPVWDVSFSPLGYFFATASHDATARLWATDKLSPLRILVGHLSDVHCVRFHPNANYVLTGSSDCSLRLWDVATGSCVRLLCGHTAAVTALALSPDGRLAASGSADKTVRLWDLGSGKQLCSYAAHAGPVWSVAFSHDEPGGGLLASGGADSAVRLWDFNAPPPALAEGEGGKPAGCVAEFLTRSTPVLCTSFTRRNLLLAAGPYTGGR